MALFKGIELTRFIALGWNLLRNTVNITTA